MNPEKILTHTIDVMNPTVYILRKAFGEETTFGNALGASLFFNGVLAFGLGIYFDKETPSYEQINFASQNIKYVKETVVKKDFLGKGLIYSSQVLITPWNIVYDLFNRQSFTEFNDTYRVEGKDIVQFSTEQGYFINELAFTQRDFYIEDRKYNQKELEDELNDLLRDYSSVKQELQEKTNLGEYTDAMNQNTDYLTKIRDLKSELSELYSAKNGLVESLQKTAQSLNQEAYKLRIETERDVEELLQKEGMNKK